MGAKLTEVGTAGTFPLLGWELGELAGETGLRMWQDRTGDRGVAVSRSGEAGGLQPKRGNGRRSVDGDVSTLRDGEGCKEWDVVQGLINYVITGITEGTPRRLVIHREAWADGSLSEECSGECRE